jgi:16S rRNA (cytosine967-C5)-methyltransferase
MSDLPPHADDPTPKAAKPVRRNDPHAPGLAARRVAALVLIDVLTRHLPLDETLDKHIGEANIPPRDAGLVRAMATASIRHLGQLRHAVRTRLSGDSLPAKVPELEPLLLVGAAQLLHLDVPDHAAVDMTVRAARENQRTLPYAKLINAVLRRIAREKDEALSEQSPLIDLPDWLAQRWVRRYGHETAARIAKACNSEAALDLSVKGDPVVLAETLGADVLPNGSLRLKDRRPVSTLPGYDEGAFWVQDMAASLPARLLHPQAGERIADLCAAPGGKTAQLALSGADVLAVDRSPARLKRLDENLRRLHLSAHTLASDAATLKTEPFDAILLDAPCSATGTLRRHPDVAWTKTFMDIGKLAELQKRLLDHALTLLKPSGRLVYCTCSLEPEEGEAQIEALLKRNPRVVRWGFTADDVPGLAQALTPQGDLRILPFMGDFGPDTATGIDGFFIARLRSLD